jgi:3-deoxy-7-phosphoheptulonate synthase
VKPEGTRFRVGSAVLGDRAFTVIAGPCAVESEKQTIETAIAVKAAGAHLLRGGAFKPRTSPYSFQGLGLEGLKILAKARRETGLPIVTEAVDDESVAQVEEFADMIQIGARNMQNFQLLKRAGRSSRPVCSSAGCPRRSTSS